MGLDGKQAEIIAQLYQDMYYKLSAYALSALNDRALAEEAVQDTFRIACMKADSLISSDNPKGWLTLTLKNVIRNTWRSRSRMNSLIIAALSIDNIIDKTIISDSCDDIDFEVSYSDLLGDEDFALLKMVIINQCTMLEAANAFGISVEACKKRAQRAKKKLRKIIEENT